jgi:peptide deformylase
MAVLQMRYHPDPVLRQRTRRVRDVDATVLKLVDDMIETMCDANGVGLAANQVGVPLRVAVIQISAEDEPTVLINPKMIRREGEREVIEGCLSIPGYQGTAKRAVKVRVRALDRDGKEFRLRSEDDVFAQAIEHELGHLNGELYIDHLGGDGKVWKLEDAPASDEDVESDEM